MNFWFPSIGYNSVYNFLHYFCVITRMDTRLFYSQMRVIFEGHCFISIVRHHIFKNFLLSQNLTTFIVAKEPKPRSLIVEVVCDAQIIRSYFLYCIFFIMHYVLSSSKYINIIVLLINIIYIYGFLVLISFNIFYIYCLIINIHCILIFTFLFSLIRVLCC